MMTNEQAAAYTVDRNARLHRPDGTFASRAEIADYRAVLVFAIDYCAARELVARRAARAFFAPEAPPVKAERLLWKGQEALLTSAHAWGHI
jgi:hypothetical protein